MDGRKGDGWICRWMDGHVGVWTGGRKDRWMDGYVGGWLVSEWKDRWMDGYMYDEIIESGWMNRWMNR